MNNGERYGSMKRAQPRAEELANQTSTAWNIYLAVPDGAAGGWYVLAQVGTLPIGNEPEPEGAIKYSHIRCVNPELQGDVVEVSSEALRDQLGADPALFSEADEISDEDLEAAGDFYDSAHSQEYTAVIRSNCDSGTDFEVLVNGRSEAHALDLAFDKGHQVTGGGEDLEVVSISPTIDVEAARDAALLKALGVDSYKAAYRSAIETIADLQEAVLKLKAASASLEEVERQAYLDAVRFETSTYLGYDEMGSSVEMCTRCRLPYQFDCKCS